MKVDKNEIANKLRKIKGILNRRMDGTGLDGILFKDDSLYVTDLEIGVKAALKSQNDNEEFVIPRSAIELIENLPDGTVEIEATDTSILIKSGTIKNKYQTFPANTYNVLKEPDNEYDNVTVPSGEFLDALDSVLYAVSDASTKEVLKGVLLDASDGYLNIVGCDAHRIAWSKIEYKESFKVIIPKQTIKRILSFGISGEISFAWDDKSIHFKSDEYEVTSRILTGEYLDYKKMFVDYPNQTIIDRKNFIECLRRAIICSGDKVANGLKCNFTDESLHVELHKTNSEYEETVKLEMPMDEPVEIAFNTRYLLECMSSFMSDHLSIKLGKGEQPILIDDGDQSALVLPVRM